MWSFQFIALFGLVAAALAAGPHGHGGYQEQYVSLSFLLRELTLVKIIQQFGKRPLS